MEALAFLVFYLLYDQWLKHRAVHDADLVLRDFDGLDYGAPTSEGVPLSRRAHGHGKR